MKFCKLSKLKVWMLVMLLTGCGGGGGSAPSAPVSTSITGQNVMQVIVDAGPAGVNAFNIPYTSVTICMPGSASCQTIDHIIVDTGSTGLRIMASALSLSLPQQMSGSANLDECLQFVDGYSWGSVRQADVKLASEATLASLSIQLIGDPAVPAVPGDCIIGKSENSVLDFGGNGIIGVGVFQQDCGAACASTAIGGTYYACSGLSCTAVSVPLSAQVQNPVGLLQVDNNGVALTLPSVAATGSTRVIGSLMLGIGTQANNAPGSATVYQLNSNGTLTTTFNSQSYPASVIDSGSNANFFPDSALAVCTGNAAGFYCPASTTSLSAINTGANNASSTISFSVVNADTLFQNSSYTASSGLGGTAMAGANSFDWGLPFFFGRTVFTAIEGKSGGGATGPYVAY